MREPRPTEDPPPGPASWIPGWTGASGEAQGNSAEQPTGVILRGLGGVVRGLAALVWALPLALAIVVWTVSRSGSGIPSPLSDLLFSLGIAPGILVTTILWYGVVQVGRFQPSLAVWQRAADRARGLGLLLVGLSPFLYWWSRRPDLVYFKIAAGALILFGLLFLAQLNALLRRLTALLPDQALREETASMARLNYFILGALGGLQLVLFGLDRVTFDAVAGLVAYRYIWLARLFLLLFMVMPLAITIAVMWKIKETILESVFAGEHR